MVTRVSQFGASVHPPPTRGASVQVQRMEETVADPATRGGGPTPPPTRVEESKNVKMARARASAARCAGKRLSRRAPAFSGRGASWRRRRRTACTRRCGCTTTAATPTGLACRARATAATRRHRGLSCCMAVTRRSYGGCTAVALRPHDAASRNARARARPRACAALPPCAATTSRPRPPLRRKRALRGRGTRARRRRAAGRSPRDRQA